MLQAQASLEDGSLVILVAAVHYRYRSVNWVQVINSPIVYKWESITVPLRMVEVNLILETARAMALRFLAPARCEAAEVFLGTHPSGAALHAGRKEKGPLGRIPSTVQFVSWAGQEWKCTIMMSPPSATVSPSD